jgi:hypothetical protein
MKILPFINPYFRKKNKPSAMQPNYNYLVEKLELSYPLIGFYDIPTTNYFLEIKPAETCVFAYFKTWAKNKWVLITPKKFGCGGAGSWLCNVKTRSRKDYIHFLADEEGLKANHDLMGKWLDNMQGYSPQHANLVIGPLVPEAYTYLKTVSFFVNPDQLSVLAIGAQLHSSPDDVEPVISPFGSGCMQLITLFKNLEIPQAIIGATDMAMRRYLPSNVLSFTVTKSMFQQLCALDQKSYLEKRFLTSLKKARKTIS